MARHAQAQQRRYWRRTDTASLPWWPWGISLIAGLIALYLYGAFAIAPAIQANTEEAVATQLASLNIPVTSVEASGQSIQITTSDEDPSTLLALARSSLCETWAGSLHCATDISVISDAETTVPTGSGQGRHHDLVFTKVGERIVLRGEVPDDQRHASLLAAATARFLEVDDQLRVTGDAGRQTDHFASRTALSLLAELDRGQVLWAQGVLSSSGLVPANREAAVREAFATAGQTVRTDGLNLRVASAQADCDDAFAEALRASTIVFATGAASIDSGSEPLLSTLAELANSCSGDLVIEGHTDNIGRPRLNRELSLTRAEAVRDALIALGVPERRLSATGLGASQPIASNRTRDGRAQNRRIVIRGADH